MTEREAGALDPRVADLVEKVEARMAAAPTPQEVRDLAERVLAETRANALTIAQIRQLTDLAIGRAQQVQDAAARLADLVRGAGDD